MKFLAKNNKSIIIRQLLPSDYKVVSDYLYKLSAESQSRFAPHAYDQDSIHNFFQINMGSLEGFISIHENTGTLIGYSLLKTGLMDYEQSRFEQYGLHLSAFTNAVYAPSVADEWQQYGIGYENLKMILEVCSKKKINRLFLWGGVQATNVKAIRFYKRNGFVELGLFEYNGKNIDMMLLI